MKIGELVKRERNRQGHSAAELARRAGINPDSLASVERSSASLRTLEKVLWALRCNLTWQGRQADQKIGSIVRNRRQERKMSQQTLATKVGVTSRSILALENRSTGRMSVLDDVLTALRIAPKVVPKNRRAVPTRNGPEHDKVYTPRQMARDVVEHFSPSGIVLEPCRGDGSFLEAFPADADARWCELDEGRDFFDWHERVDWIISNPPWSEFRAFNIHAMSLATNVVWIIPLVHFSSRARIRDVRDAGFGLKEILLLDTPKEWPQGGFQIAALHFQKGFKGRTKMSGL